MKTLNKEKAIQVLTAERECVAADCDRDCSKCALVMDKDWLLSGLDDALKLLKEQEAVEPKEIVNEHFPIGDYRRTIGWLCGKCGKALMGNGVYCSYCGKKVKWE